MIANLMTHAAQTPDAGPFGVVPSVVIACSDEGSPIEVRFVGGSSRGHLASARCAVASLYRPTEGDRVLVAQGVDGELYIVGVVHAARRTSMPFADGSVLAIEDDRIEIRDGEGRLRVRYADGSAEITASCGDLILSAPEGRVWVKSGRDVEIEASGAVRHRGGRVVETFAGNAEQPQLRVGAGQTRLMTERMDVQAGESHVSVGRATIVAGHIATAASTVTHEIERLEIAAGRLVERTRETFREASGLLQTRAGRARTLIEGAYDLLSRRTSIQSKEETSIDGSKILLG